MAPVFEALGCLALFGLLILALYAATKDERDNMRGGCKAAAIKAMNHNV